MSYLAEKTKLGMLEMLDVYVYYDIPRLFSCKNEYGQKYLALSIGDSDEVYSWVYVAVSSKRLKSITGGEMDIRDAFRETENGAVLLVTITPEGDSVVPSLPSEVSDSLLPKKGKRLKPAKKQGTQILTTTTPHIQHIVETDEELIAKAFLDVRSQFSVDKVIADPKSNNAFLRRSRELGLDYSAYVLNRKLMGMRKSSQLTGLQSQRFVIDSDTSNRIDFASELAWRYLALTKGASLDDILCDPNLAAEFDKLTSLVSPGFQPLEYRWAALQVRKSGRHAKEGYELRGTYEFDSPIKMTSIRKKDMPEEGGLYLFFYEGNPLFVSQADSLRQRIEIHFENTSHRGLPDWIWPSKNKVIEVAFSPLPGIPKTRRKGMEVDQVSLKKPIFNVQRVHAA